MTDPEQGAQPTDGPVSNFNIANVLTVLRIAGVPVFGWLLLTSGGDSVAWRIAAGVAFTVLMATDKLDGDLARKHNLVTDFGKIADPIADKALTGMAFVGLSIIGVLWWPVTILMLVREWGITALRAVMLRRGIVMPASAGGKLKTLLQAFAIAGYVLPFTVWSGIVPEVLLWVTHGLMAAALAVALITGAMYVYEAQRLARDAARS